MAITPKVLAEGQLAAAKATLYTVPGATSTIVSSITLTNTDAAARTVNIYVKPGGTSRRVVPKDLSIAAGYSVIDDTVRTLETGDLIEGDASAANVVDYVISGMEVT